MVAFGGVTGNYPPVRTQRREHDLPAGIPASELLVDAVILTKGRSKFGNGLINGTR
jgi:hypothetical protein